MGYYSNYHIEMTEHEEIAAYEALCQMSTQEYYATCWTEEEAIKLAMEHKQDDEEATPTFTQTLDKDDYLEV